ncbi:hypothetical protein PI95_033210 [Hassallia byssoidea VB512170]|uniref:Uncharacterized protein n=1 Tax=Hassallia byssoidea VB512170 TaxID=1304833 RepID=A0A846HKJ1_9CYAN|nr:hypothetical protein [Hassalia byssoidea]MBW4566654.1 hypothetical protein [Tolypothrix carrinoi HA7290-LM1]NEU77219.1 hypothetical protein [Hassalia byssoidea VB512170]
MARKGGNPKIKDYGFTSDRDEPLTGRLAIRVTQSMLARVKALDNYPEFCRQVLAKALDELEKED